MVHFTFNMSRWKTGNAISRLVNTFYEYCFLLGLRQTNIPQAAQHALREHPARKLCNNPVSSWRQVFPLGVHIYGIKQAAQLVCTSEPVTAQSKLDSMIITDGD